MSRGFRLLAFLLLLALTLGLCVGYGGADRWTYPSETALVEEFETYDGQGVLLFVRVTERNGAIVQGEDVDFAFDIQAVDRGVRDRVEAGSSVQVRGTVQADDNTVAVERVIVDYQGQGDWLYLAATSGLGVALALSLFFRHWRLTVDGIEPRGESRG